MLISEITQKMIAYSHGNRHDICHFLKVWAYAKTIGELEGLDADTQTTLEIAALVHDIACPVCRVKYGNTNGKHQEAEGAGLADAFLSGMGLSDDMRNRVIFLVSHHHTLTGVDGADYQILLEADYLVNADEGGYSPQSIQSALRTLFQTPSGISLLRSVYADSPS